MSDSYYFITHISATNAPLSHGFGEEKDSLRSVFESFKVENFKHSLGFSLSMFEFSPERARVSNFIGWLRTEQEDSEFRPDLTLLVFDSEDHFVGGYMFPCIQYMGTKFQGTQFGSQKDWVRLFYFQCGSIKRIKDERELSENVVLFLDNRRPESATKKRGEESAHQSDPLVGSACPNT